MVLLPSGGVSQDMLTSRCLAPAAMVRPVGCHVGRHGGVDGGYGHRSQGVGRAEVVTLVLHRAEDIAVLGVCCRRWPLRGRRTPLS